MIGKDRRSILRGGVAALLGPLAAVEPLAQAQHTAGRAAAAVPSKTAEDCNCTRAPDGSPLDTGTSELRPAIERFGVELRDLNRVYPLLGSPTRGAKLAAFYSVQLRLLEEIRFDALSQPGRVDYLLFRSHLIHEQKQLTVQAIQEGEIAPLIPFQQTIVGLEESRRGMQTVDAQRFAETLTKMSAEIATARAAHAKASPAVLHRAAVRLGQLRNTLRTWYNFYDLYDPKFSWWVEGEYKKSDEALAAYAKDLNAGAGMPETVHEEEGADGRGRGGEAAASNGDRNNTPPRSGPPLGSNEELSGAGPVGSDALTESLRNAMIPYSPEELIALASREFAWCDKEMLRASAEMGFASDWKKALEAVKNKYVEPGRMIGLVRDLALEAIDFVEKHELVTIPAMAKADYWEEAMTPRMQLVNPFFTGGPTIQVSSPANSMTTAEKLESMRGNNIYFARATVFHELIPGHHMQMYMM